MTAEIYTIKGHRIPSRNAMFEVDPFELPEPSYTLWQIQSLLRELDKASRDQKMAEKVDIVRCFNQLGTILFELL